MEIDVALPSHFNLAHIPDSYHCKTSADHENEVSIWVGEDPEKVHRGVLIVCRMYLLHI